MSDLDDFFANKLQEEASFPNRGKNWKQMSKRLDAFDAGGLQGNGPKLRWWQAATVVALVTIGVLLWKNVTSHRANQALHQEVATLKQDRLDLQTRIAVVEKKIAGFKAPDQSVKTETSEADLAVIKHTGTKETETLDIQQKGKFYSKTPVNKAIPPAEFAESKETPSGPSTKPNNASDLLAATPKSGNEASNQTLKSETASLDTSSQKQEALVAQKETAIDSVLTKVVAKDTLQTQTENVAEASKPAQEIKPAKIHSNHFRVGMFATLGFVQPKQAGVSSIKGQGLMLEAKVFRNLWVNTSVEWLRHEVCTREFVPKFHPHHDSLPEPPNNGGGGGGWPHPPKLVQVESDPRQQHFSIGLRYELPVKFWVRPSLRIAHAWVHMAPSTITYKFEEDDPIGPWPNPHDHDPEYAVETFKSQWLSNQWKFGVGLEKDIPNWTFGLWADYSKDFSVATPGFDALYLRAGAQFRF